MERVTLYRGYDSDGNVETVSIEPGSSDERLFRALGFSESKPKGRPPGGGGDAK